MKKKINKIKLNLNAGKAIPNSTIGSILGQYSINIALFCKEYNNKTQLYIGLQIPVIIIFYNNKKIILNLKTPSLSFLILFYSQNNFININNNDMITTNIINHGGQQREGWEKESRCLSLVLS